MLEPPDHYGLALVLGGAEATLWDVTRAYANLADRARPAGAGPESGYREIRMLWPTNDAGSEASSPSAHPLTIGAAWLTQQALPPLRAGCGAASADENAAMEFLYPGASGKIYVPVELDGRKGRAVFEAVHRDPRAVLFWHLDEKFAGRTADVHQLAVDLSPGPHRVTVVDQAGNRLTRAFEILASSGPYAATP